MPNELVEWNTKKTDRHKMPVRRYFHIGIIYKQVCRIIYTHLLMNERIQFACFLQQHNKH